MKRIIALTLSFVLLIGCFSSAAAAFDAGEENEYPIIIVPGYSSSQLVRVNDDGTTEGVWYIDINTVLDVVKQYIPQLVLGAGLLAAEQPDYLAASQFKVDTVKRGLPGIAFGKVFDF